MSATVYCFVGFLIAAWLGAQGDIEQGDWPKATALIVMCAVWPMMIGLGFGLLVASVLRLAKSLIAKARSAA